MNLANKLTLLRIVLVPVFLIFISFNTPIALAISTLIFIVAAITDQLDGYIARRRNQVTRFGKFMDPLADKLLVTSALVALVQYNIIPTWIAMIIIGREFAVTGLRSIAAAEGIVIAASWWGKIKTVTQMVTIIAYLITLFFESAFIENIAYISLIVATITTLISGIDYFIKNKNAISTNV
jgi:CDP-diacylglycerol--glycerol-3-phosphate 3-phosphatidyltransferase